MVWFSPTNSKFRAVTSLHQWEKSVQIFQHVMGNTDYQFSIPILVGIILLFLKLLILATSVFSLFHTYFGISRSLCFSRYRGYSVWVHKFRVSFTKYDILHLQASFTLQQNIHLRAVKDWWGGGH